MGCTRNLSRIYSSQLIRLALWSICLTFLLPNLCIAAVASKFSVSVGEIYTDNVFFSKDKEHDFITVITPKLSIFYAPQGEPIPTLNFNISPSGQFFARHSELNNFGDNISMDGGFTKQFSPRFTLHASDTLSRSGDSRVADIGFGPEGLLNTPTSLPVQGSTVSSPSSQNLKDFVTSGDLVTNFFTTQGTYLYSPTTSINGYYTNEFTKFIDEGGTDYFHTIGVRGVFKWRQEHNLHAGYAIRIGKSRDGEDSVIHDFDLGDDFFSNFQIRLSPTLTVAASTGVSLNLGNEGPQIANNTNITIIKLWETATLTGGLRKGLTPSFGVAGLSDTTSFFSNFDLRLTEKLSANSGVDFSFYDTDDVNFKTFQAKLGFQYLITSWLSSHLGYNFRWVDRGSAPSDVTLLDKGIVRGNTLFAALAVQFDLWPNIGLGRSLSSPVLSPVIRTPFPIGPSPGAPAIP